MARRESLQDLTVDQLVERFIDIAGVAMMLWQWGQQPWMPMAIGGVALLIVVGVGAAIAVKRGPANPARKERIGIASLGARVGIASRCPRSWLRNRKRWWRSCCSRPDSLPGSSRP